MVLLQGKLYFSKDLGRPILPGSQTFYGVQMLISLETHITCDFPGGPDPYPPSGFAHGSEHLMFTNPKISKNKIHDG